MNEKQKAEVEAIVLATLEKELPRLLGRSLPQVKEYLIANIT